MYYQTKRYSKNRAEFKFDLLVLIKFGFRLGNFYKEKSNFVCMSLYEYVVCKIGTDY